MANRGSVTLYEAAEKKRLKVSALLIFILIPGILALSIFLSNSRMYLLLSTLMLFIIMAPFFMIFERRKPKAREMVLIAVLSAIVVTLHIFFHIVIPVQVGTALIIIFGATLGPEAGFLIGALSRFICNFYMGQGMWTPWQMFAWGLLGFLAGFVFRRADSEESFTDFKTVTKPVLTVAFFELMGYLSYLVNPGRDESFISWRLYVFGAVGLVFSVILMRRRIPANSVTLALFTFLSTFILYGGLMNFAAMVTGAGFQDEQGMNWDTLRALYISGVPYDLMHSIFASIMVFLMGKPFMDKVNRIIIKYGIYK